MRKQNDMSYYPYGQKKKSRFSAKLIIWIVAIAVSASFIYPASYTTALNDAAKNGNMTAMKIILMLPGNLNRNNHALAFEYASAYPLTTACRYGTLEMVEAMVRHGAEINIGSGMMTPLFGACYSNTPDQFAKIRYLVENGADVNLPSSHALSIANISFDENDDADKREAFEIFRYLQGQGSLLEANAEGGFDDSLYEYASSGNIYIVEYLIENEYFEINHQRAGGFSALMGAARGGNADIVEYLLAHGADVNIQQNQGMTALAFAKEEGYADIVQMLEDAGAKSG
jgi:ankyrin repeat protein